MLTKLIPSGAAVILPLSELDTREEAALRTLVESSEVTENPSLAWRRGVALVFVLVIVLLLVLVLVLVLYY